MRASEVAEAIRILETELPKDIEDALREEVNKENGLASEVLQIILKNVEYAKKKHVPICQDTGSLIFFMASGAYNRHHWDAIEKGVRMATQIVPLRANTVNPFTRENEKRNTGKGNPIVYFESNPSLGKNIQLGIMAKGAGSENVGRGYMLEPDLGISGIRDAVLKTVSEAGGKPCPPIILGIGIGGTADMAHMLSKKAFMRPLDAKTDDPNADALERELLERVNQLGIGPMGLGGKCTALGVRVEWAHCHTASLPISVSIGCWALRRILVEWKEGEFTIVR